MSDSYVRGTVRPYGAHVLIEVLPTATRTPGGLYVPDNVRQRPNRARVLAVGPGGWKGPRRVEPLVKAGDVVVFDPYKIKLVMADNAMANAQGTPFAGVGDQCLVDEETLQGVEL